jgi:2-dehydro-3-deoxy-D-arabinonate dehydratase
MSPFVPLPPFPTLLLIRPFRHPFIRFSSVDPLYSFSSAFAKISPVKLVQFWRPNSGYRVGLVRGENVLDITMPEAGLKSTSDLIEHAAVGNLSLAEFVESQLSAAPRAVYALHELDISRDLFVSHLALPILPPEVWAAVDAYLHTQESEPSEPITPPPCPPARPELFFKGTAARCVGPNTPIGIRRDSSCTVPEPGLALVLGPHGGIAAYTIADDVTARDIGGENPLYLSQAKIFRGACALGPALVTPDELGALSDLVVRCRIERGGATVFAETCSLGPFTRPLDELLEYLLRDNPVPGGSVLCLGTGADIPPTAALEESDIVEIEIPPIGILRNPVKRWGEA